MCHIVRAVLLAFATDMARTGVHNAKRESYGHSIAINAWGDVGTLRT